MVGSGKRWKISFGPASLRCASRYQQVMYKCSITLTAQLKRQPPTPTHASLTTLPPLVPCSLPCRVALLELHNFNTITLTAPSPAVLHRRVALPPLPHRWMVDPPTTLKHQPPTPLRSPTTGMAHEVNIPSFEMARAPVTNSEFLRFVEDGGYARREHWSHEGWRWLTRK